MKTGLCVFLLLVLVVVAPACGKEQAEPASGIKPGLPARTPLPEPGRPPTPPPALAQIPRTPTPNSTPVGTPTPEAAAEADEEHGADGLDDTPEEEAGGALPAPAEGLATSTPAAGTVPTTESATSIAPAVELPTVLPTSTGTPTPMPTATPTATPTPTPTAMPTPRPQLEFSAVRVSGNPPSQVQIIFSLRDDGGHSLVIPAEQLHDAARIFELGPGAQDWEEIDYAETSFFVHSAEDFELEVVFVLDFTKSMALAGLPDGPSGIEAMLEAFRQAVTGLPGAHRVGVVEFHDRATVPGTLSQLTTDRDAIVESVAAFAASPFEPGSSRVWDSIQTAAGLFTTQEENPNVVRALVFLSDGRDTSSESVREDVGETAVEEGIQLYALGVGEVFEEEQLEAMVVASGGVYYPARELEALQEQLQVLVGDLSGQYRVTYITLRRQGTSQTRVQFDLPEGTGSFVTPPMEVSTFYGPDTEGRISFDPPSVDRGQGTAQVFIRALHVPRNVSSFRFKLDTGKPVVLNIVPETAGGLLEGWTLAERPDAEGYFLAQNEEPLAFGNFGLLFQLTMSEITEKSLVVTVMFDNSIYTSGQSFTSPAEFFVGERILGSGNIAFRSDRDGNLEIYVMKFDGSDQENVTNHPFDDFLPSWSPDGQKIAFDSNRDGKRQLYVMNADGTGVQRLTGIGSNNRIPAWSPGGGRIAFDSDRDGNREIYLIRVDGSGQTRLTNDPANDWWPAWSPDGGMVAFTSLRDGDAEVYVMDVEDGVPVNLTSNPADDYRPAWSPDGRRIAFYSLRDGNREVYVMNVDGTGQVNLTNHPGNDWAPTWSPDGLRIAFTTTRDGNQEIYTMAGDGSRQRNATDHPARDAAPAWGP